MMNPLARTLVRAFSFARTYFFEKNSTTALAAMAIFTLITIPTGIALAATPSVPGNLIANPQMQSATVSSTTPDNWFQGGYGVSSTTYAYPVPGPEAGDVGATVTLSNYTNGAAEWYFQNVPVTGNALYTFSDDYNANVESYLIAQWTLNDGTFEYDAVATLPSTNGSWVTTPQETFPAPANATQVTILHLIQNGNGTLTTSNYALTPYAATTTGAFSKGIVSLTFDDGWASQFDNARPILKAAGIPGTFYIITDPVLDATAGGSTNIIDDSGVSTSTVSAQGDISWGDITNIPVAGAIYTDPTYQQYTFSDTYTATTTSTVTVDYCSTALASSSCPAIDVTSLVLGTLPAGTNAPASFSFSLPTTAGNTVSPISIKQTVGDGNTISASSPSLTEYQQYMTEAQLAALQADGDEIDSHTETHPDLDLTSLTSAEADAEISGSRSTLLGFGNTPVTGFAYPFGDYNSTVIQDVSNAGYTNARTVDVGFNTETSNPLSLKSESAVASTTFPTVKSWIDAAIANKWWLVITLHDVDPANVIAENGETYGVTPDMLQQIVSYLKTQQDSGNVTVGTMNQDAALLTGTTPVVPITPPATTTPVIVPDVEINPSTLPAGTVGTPYSQTFTASTTAVGSFVWGISAGTRPPGLNLDATTTSIDGTPTTPGTFSFTVSTTNGTSSTTQNYSVLINAAVPTSVSTPVTSSSGGGGNSGQIVTTTSHGAAPRQNTSTTTATTSSSTAATGQVLGATTFDFLNNLYIGLRGNDVTELQKILIGDGYLKISPPTGYFGTMTRAAVKLFQAAHGVPNTGFVGPLTRAVLNK